MSPGTVNDEYRGTTVQVIFLIEESCDFVSTSPLGVSCYDVFVVASRKTEVKLREEFKLEADN